MLTNGASTFGALSRRLMRDTRGVALPLVAVTLTALIGFAGLGIETGLWYTIKRHNQSAADFGAISGARELYYGSAYLVAGPPAEGICGLAQRDAGGNGFTFAAGWSCPDKSPTAQSACTSLSSGQACVNNPPLFSTSAGDAEAVEVILAQQQNTFFANLFLPNVTIDVRAVAKIQQVGIDCSLALGQTGIDVTLQGSAHVDLTGCGISANSSSSNSFSFGGGKNDVLDASWFQTVGNYSSNGNPQINVPQIITFGNPTTDPFSCNPPQLGCAGQIKYTAPTSTTCTAAPANGTISPLAAGQFYCPISVGNGNTLHLTAGVYYINGAPTSGPDKGSAFSVASGGTVTGTDVTIIATGTGTGSTGTGGGFNITSNATVQLSAPTTSTPSGIPSGLLLYQDPAHANTSKSGSGLTADSTITANSNTALQGTMYTPATNVTFTGNSNSTCFDVIALTITYTGNSTISANQSACSAVGVTPPSVIDIVLAE